MDAASIAAILGGFRNGRRWMVRCPCSTHGKGKGDSNPSLSISDGHGGKLLVRCFAGCDPVDVLKSLPSDGRHQPDPVLDHVARERERAAQDDADKRKAAALKIWKSARKPQGTIAEGYLRARGITGAIPLSIRFARCYLDGQHVPAMISAFQGADRSIIGIQRTFVSDGLRSPITRKMLGDTTGGAVRLAAPRDGLIGIAEGVETGLAAMQLIGVPVWCVGGTSGLAGIILPSVISRVLILADHDRPGIVAARKAAQAHRRNGISVSTIYPSRRGCDYNDLLMG